MRCDTILLSILVSSKITAVQSNYFDVIKYGSFTLNERDGDIASRQLPTEFNLMSTLIRNNKKVLLRERKRHTARRVASVHCADLPWLGGVPTLAGGRGPGGYLPWSGSVPTLAGVPPPPGVDRRPVKTVPFPILGCGRKKFKKIFAFAFTFL